MGEVGWAGAGWLTLSMLAATGASCGVFLPYWLHGTYQQASPVFLGTFRRCNYPRQDEQGRVELVRECGRYTRFSDIPSLWWQLSTLACATGAALALLVACAGLTALCVRHVLTRGTARLAAVLQLIAGTSGVEGHIGTGVEGLIGTTIEDRDRYRGTSVEGQIGSGIEDRDRRRGTDRDRHRGTDRDRR